MWQLPPTLPPLPSTPRLASCIHIYGFMYTYLRIYVCIFACIRTYMNTYIHIHTHLEFVKREVTRRVYMFASTHVYRCIHTHLQTYIHKNIQTKKQICTHLEFVGRDMIREQISSTKNTFWHLLPKLLHEPAHTLAAISSSSPPSSPRSDTHVS